MLDETDIGILEILRKNARTPFLGISKKLRISESTIRKRVKELEREGYLREILRRVQSLRKKNGLNIKDRILLDIDSDYDLSEFEKEIMNKVGARKVTFNGRKHKISSLEKIKGKKFDISFQKL